jgi:hypothetical protein
MSILEGVPDYRGLGLERFTVGSSMKIPAGPPELGDKWLTAFLAKPQRIAVKRSFEDK